MRQLAWAILGLGIVGFGVWFVAGRWACLMVHRHGLPPELIQSLPDKRSGMVAFIYDPGTVDHAEALAILRGLDRGRTCLVVDSAFDPDQVSRLIERLDWQGCVVAGDDRSERYLRRLSVCLERPDWQQTVLVEVDSRGRAGSFRALND